MHLPKRAAASRGRPSLHRQSFIKVGKNQCLVFDARGEQETGVLGDIYAAQIKANGGVALVTDGCTRDIPEMEEVGLPIFARGVSGNGFGTRHLAADQNVPIQCGGVLVMPGDVIVGSEIGVVVIPSALAEKVAEEAARQVEAVLREGRDPRRARRAYERYLARTTAPFFRLVRSYYRHPFRELLVSGGGPLGVDRATLSLLAGAVFPRLPLAVRWRMALLYALLAVHERIPLAPRRRAYALAEMAPDTG